jgi:maltose-binding protein MalE
MFYRRDLYEQAGIDVDAIETWDDFIAAGQAMNAATDGAVKMGTVAKGGDDEWFRMLANQAGCFYFDQAATEVTVAQPGCVSALDTLKKLYDADVLAVGGWVEQIQLLQNSAAASALFGAWYGGVIQAEMPDQSGLWGVYLTPALEPGGVRASNLGGSALAIPASSENPELAYDFIVNALADEENQLASSSTTASPRRCCRSSTARARPGRRVLRRPGRLGRHPRHPGRGPRGRRHAVLPGGPRGDDRHRQHLPRRRLPDRAGRARPRRPADLPGHRPARSR